MPKENVLRELPVKTEGKKKDERKRGFRNVTRLRRSYIREAGGKMGRGRSKSNMKSKPEKGKKPWR